MNRKSNDNNNMETLDIKKLLSDFTDRQVTYSERVAKLFNGCCRNSSKPFLCDVDAVKSIIIPLFRALKEHFPQLQLPDKNGYGLAGGYYKLRIGDQVIGGFSYPQRGRDFLIYTPFTGNPENTAIFNISCLQQIVQIIDKQLNSNKIP